MNTAKVTTPSVETPKVEVAEQPKANVDMDAILERIDRLEKENEELKQGKMNVFTQGKQVYT